MSSEEETEVSAWPFGFEGEDGDVPMPKGKVMLKVNELLQRAEVDAGELSVGGAADGLSSVPGLTIEGEPLRLPLKPSESRELVALISKLNGADDTMNGEQLNTWRLQAQHVTFTNPWWSKRLEELCASVGERMGFKGVKLICELQELVIYGEGAYADKYQEQKNDGVVAKLLIQLPSEHAGGALVVYRGRDLTFRYDFGVDEGMSPYLPFYAAHFADALFSRDQVTGGFQLVLVYSLSLPVEMRHLENAKGERPLSEELTEALKEVEPDDDYFALLLANSYKDEDIGARGLEVLSGVDQTRLRVLLEATSLLPADKAFVFYIAKLSQTTLVSVRGRSSSYYDYDSCSSSETSWVLNDKRECVSWYTVRGEKLGETVISLKPGDSIHRLPTPMLLDPDNTSLKQMWQQSVSYGSKEGETWRRQDCCQWTLFAWPAAKNVGYTLTFVGSTCALAALESQKPLASSTLRAFMEKAIVELPKEQERSPDRYKITHPLALAFSQRVVDLIVDVGDAALVGFYFDKFYTSLAKKDEFVDKVVLLLKSFQWVEVRDTILKAFIPPARNPRGQLRSYERGQRLKLTLQVIAGLDAGQARTELLNATVESAVAFTPPKLIQSDCFDSLCSVAIHCDDDRVLSTLASHLESMDPAFLSTATDSILKHTADVDVRDPKFESLALLVGRRLQWVNRQIEKHDKPFSWEMPKAQFVDSARIHAFLRGPEQTITTVGLVFFRNFKHAKRWTRHDRVQASFDMTAEGDGGDAFVTITKTRVWYERQQQMVAELKAEREKLLAAGFQGLEDEDPATMGDKKRRRVEVAAGK